MIKSSQLRKVLIATALLSVFTTAPSDAHIRISPTGRMGTNDAVKFIQNNKANPTVPDNPGPCQRFTTRMATPLSVNPGSTFTFTLTETINHPGRFYVQFSPGGDTGFWSPANGLALVQDTQSNGVTTIPVTIPNMPGCSTCTLRVLQEMDDQPGEFYVHCVDINILAASTPAGPTATPPDGPTTLGNKGVADVQKPGFGGCGLVASVGSSGGGSGSGGWSGGAKALVTALLLIPLMLSFFLQQRLRPARAGRRPRR